MPRMKAKREGKCAVQVYKILVVKAVALAKYEHCFLLTIP